MILIFDTFSGLCNQFYDIMNGINFCEKNNIQFTFRYCSFRNTNLTSWTNQPFEKLFDTSFLNKYKLYINYYSINDKLTNDNCYNLNTNITAINFLNTNDDILDKLTQLNKDYVVLKQFWAVYGFKNFIYNDIQNYIYPQKDLMDKYIQIKQSIINDEPYNCIHYRYEHDFTNYFKIAVDSLGSLIDKIKFKNNKLKLFIATSNINNILDLTNSKYINVIHKNYKDNSLLAGLNSEQLAFIDYMFCLNSEEFYGHSKSSFSSMIKLRCQNSNFYA